MSAGKRKKGHAPRFSKARLREMTEQATVDAYGESEQVTGWFTMIEEKLSTPFATVVLGVPATVQRIDMTDVGDFRAAPVCRRRDYGSGRC